MDRGAWWAAVHGVTQSRTWLSDFTFTFHFPALEKEMATHSSVLAWRIPGTGEPGGLPSVGSHRVGHDWSCRSILSPLPLVHPSVAPADVFWDTLLLRRDLLMNLSLLGQPSYDPLCYHCLEWWKVKKGNMMRDGRKTLLLLMTRNYLFREDPVFSKCGSSQKGFLLTSGIWELRNGCEALVSNHSWQVLRLTVEKKVRELVCNILMKVKKEEGKRKN